MLKVMAAFARFSVFFFNELMNPLLCITLQNVANYSTCKEHRLLGEVRKAYATIDGTCLPDHHNKICCCTKLRN